MANDATLVRVGITGSVFVAPIGTAMPLDFDDALNVAFVDLGYFDEDGIDVEPDVTSKMLRAWQSKYPVRVLTTERSFKAKFKVMQTGKEALKLAFGGGTFTALTTPSTGTLYTPPAAETVYERATIVEVKDGTLVYRYLMPRCMIADVGAITFKKDEAITFDVTLEALEPAAGTSPWTMVTNDTALA